MLNKFLTCTCVFLLWFLSPSYAQAWRNYFFGENTYLIEGWNRSGKIKTKHIFLTTENKDDLNLTFISHLKNELENYNYQVATYKTKQKNHDSFIISFKDIGSSLRLISIKDDPTQCRQLIIKQLSHFPFKEKRLIRSKLYIREENYKKSTKDCAIDLAKLIHQTIQ